jgi:flavin reductase (DIM6/NTAB) family NADH-FMN oxidoreductase RutF
MIAMDGTARKDTLRMITNGMYVMTSVAGADHGVATVTWLSQASFKPPLVMAAIRPESHVFRCLSKSGVVAVHILDSSQQDLAQRFFAPTRVGDGLINGEPFAPGLTHAPILDSACAYFECLVRQIVRLGDHAIVIMEVIEARCRRQAPPLTIAGSPWKYGG